MKINSNLQSTHTRFKDTQIKLKNIINNKEILDCSSQLAQVIDDVKTQIEDKNIFESL